MRRLALTLLLATSAYAYDGIDIWSMGVAARLNNVSEGSSSVDSTLILWARMDESTNVLGSWNSPDSSTYERSGEQTNAAARPLAIVLSGAATNGLRFDGTTDYVPYGTMPVGITQHSACAWIKTSASTYSTFLNFYGTTNNYGQEFGALVQVAAVNGSVWAAGAIRYYLTHGNGATHINVNSGAATINDNNWHHVAVTTDGANSHKIYIDGIEVTNDTRSASGQLIIADKSPIDIGAQRDLDVAPYTPYQFIQGDIDDARIYGNRVLTSGEVYALYSEAPSTNR